MSKGYKISVSFSDSRATQDLFIHATNAGLIAMLRTLDDSSSIESYSVYSGVTVPMSMKLTNLKYSDIGIDTLKKLK